MRCAVAACALVLAMVTAAGAVTGDQLETFQQNLSGALLDMGLVPADCRIRSDYAAPDSFRLPLVDSLMDDPTSLLRRVDGIATGIESDTSLAGEVARLWQAMSIGVTLPTATREYPWIPLDKYRRFSHTRWDDLSRKARPQLPGGRIRDIRGCLAHLPSAINQPIAAYLGRLHALTHTREVAVETVAQDMDFLRANSSFLVTPRPEHDDVSPFELDSLETVDTALGDSILHLSEKIEVSAIAIMSASAAHAAEHLASHLKDFEPYSSSPHARGLSRYSGGKVTFAGKTSTVTGKVLYLGATDWGPVVIGDSAANTYEGSFALIIDLGGDDIYDLASNPAISFDLIIDQAGDDVYRSKHNTALAGSIFGTSIIMDLAGDDTYQAKDISLGAGIFGAGILYDRTGNDTYTSGAFSQGAGFLGVGLVRDDAGNDSYTAAMQSQAFGYVMGAGVMLERGGNDTYLTKMSQTDILRYDDHYLSFSQGCAFGSRPDYSGGIGLLIDSAGNDLYSSDIFGQGAGYWYCVGALIDRGGHDCYRSYQYAQGSGIHLGFGLLLDEWGNDYYVSKGVSQGCGHDLALGLLADLSGNDCYTAVDLSQGAGSANGTGILYDADGVDSYSAKSMVNVNGYGNYRREFGSIGLEIDVKGTDFYAALGQNDSLWQSGRYGLGIDIPGDASKPTGDIVVKEYPFEERAFTTRELYILAMRIEPRFKMWKTYAFNKMVEDSVASIAYLRTVLDVKDGPRRDGIKDVLVKIGVPAVPMLCDEVRKGNDLVKAEASWILGLIGNVGGFEALMDLSHSENWKHRSGALNSLARLKGLGPDDEERLQQRVVAAFEDGGEVFYVQKDAAFAAGNRAYLDLVPQLVGCLDHSHYSVRYAAAEALRQLSAAPATSSSPPPGTASSAPVSPAPISRASAAQQPHDQVVLGALKSELSGLTTEGFIAAIYAGSDLPAEGKLDLLEAGLGTSHSRDLHGAIALAKLAAGSKPEKPAEKKRLEGLTARLPQDSWEVKAILKR
jgi:hypothetical protein